jgi:hypothetical protein
LPEAICPLTKGRKRIESTSLEKLEARVRLVKEKKLDVPTS